MGFLIMNKTCKMKIVSSFFIYTECGFEVPFSMASKFIYCPKCGKLIRNRKDIAYKWENCVPDLIEELKDEVKIKNDFDYKDIEDWT